MANQGRSYPWLRVWVRFLRPFRHVALLLLASALALGPARAQGTRPAADSARTVADSAKARADSIKVRADTSKKVDLFGQKTDLGLYMHGSLESKLERNQNERCVSSQFFNVAAQCNSSFQPSFDFQFLVKTSGTLADRVHINVDYDAARELDASNNISLYYEGKKSDWLQRVDVGNVSFEVPVSRFITSGIPQGNYGVQAVAKFGALRVRAIAAQQKGNVVRDRVFTVGGHTQSSGGRDVEDYAVEARRFFFTVDPRQFSGYPNVDILNGARMRQLALALPDTVRPVRVQLYRLLIGGQPPNPNGPQFQLIGDPNSRRGQVYEVLRENVDYYVDPSQLWIVLRQSLKPNSERLVVAYTVHVNGRDTTIALTGGTPDVDYQSSRPQYANLLWDPNVRPGDPAFFREMRSVYRVGGEDVRRETVAISIVTGATFDQEKPVAGVAQSFLQLFGLAQLGNPSAFDFNNRLWPRPGDPITAIGGTANARIVRDQFLVFPSLQPFGRAGLAQPAANPSNDAIYTTPSEYLYSTQHPQAVYHVRMKYESDGTGDPGTLDLPSNQLRKFSERLTLDNGVVLRREVDYTIDYEVGRVTFLHADTLFTQPRNVTVRYEESNPLISTVPTSIFGIASTMPFRAGDVNFIAIAQKQNSSFTRPPLGYENQSALIAGVNGAFSWDAPAISRLMGYLPGANARAPSRIRVDAEVATSRPQPGGAGQAYIETFEGNGSVSSLTLNDPSWYYSSQPALGTKLSSRIGGSTTLDLSRAATMAWQNNGLNTNGASVTVTLQQIDPRTIIVGSGLQQPEQVLWLTLYPLSVGGAYNSANKKYQWLVPNAPTGRRWRSIRQQLGASGTDLSTVEAVEFWTQVDTSSARRKRNSTLVIDLGDVSENTVAAGPTQVIVSRNGAAVDSVYGGRAIYGRDTLQSERDPFSRSFNQEKNDTGLPGDVIPKLLFASPDSSGTINNFKMCSRGNNRIVKLGDTQTNCTVNNGRLDEWDLDGDNVLNFDSSQREQERLFRYVIDLSDPKLYSQVGACGPSPADSLGGFGAPLCWVKVSVPFGAAFDTINGGPSVRRVRALRLTMISGATVGDNEFVQIPIAEFHLTGASWTKRSDRPLTGIGGDRTSAGFVIAGSIGTQDRDSTTGLIYESPPGVVDQADKKLSGLENQRIVINERSLRLRTTALAKFERAEAYTRFSAGPQNFLSYKELRVWARGHGNGWGQTGELNFYIKIGRDVNNFYAFRTPVNSGSGQATWLPEVRVDFGKLQALRLKLQNAALQNRPDSVSCTGADSALIAKSILPSGQVSRRFAACADGYIAYTVDPTVSPPNLASVQELAVGIVRVDSAGASPSHILVGDTLEVWVDDITLVNVVNTPGYAENLGMSIQAGDVGDMRINWSRRDPNFRQLGEVPTNVGANNIDFSSNLRLERFLPGLGLSMPLSIYHSSSVSAQQFVANSDIIASGVQGLRTPQSQSTNIALTIRRSTPVTGSWIGPIVNNLSLNTSVSSASSTASFQTGSSRLFTAGADYVVGGESNKQAMPVWWERVFNALPGWLGNAEFMQALRSAEFHNRPASFRLSSRYLNGDDKRFNYSRPANSLFDTATVVRGLTSFWRNATSLDVQPFDALDARWELSTLRDLHNYGDSTPSAIVAGTERTRLLGFDTGLERERLLSSYYSFLPSLKGWFRPRFDFSTTYALQRDPNTTQLLRETDNTGAFRLPRRVNNLQLMNAGASFDIARVASAFVHDSAFLARTAHTLVPLDLSYSRTLTSAFDGTPFTPGYGFQFGLNDVGGFLRDHGILATTASSNEQVGLSSGLRLPFGIRFIARTRRVATRNWLTRADNSQAVIDGEQITLPDLSLSGTFRPRSLESFITSIGASAGLIETRQRSIAPSGTPLVPDDIRTTRLLTYPFSMNVEWAERGMLRTSFTMSSRFQTDSLPGSVADSRGRELSADLSRSFKLPVGWQLKSSLRTHLSYQQSNTQSYVQNALGASGTRSRLADNGRQAITLNADTDVADNVTFSLQSARIVTFDNNLNRRFTQYVLTATLQLSFFAGELR